MRRPRYDFMYNCKNYGHCLAQCHVTSTDSTSNNLYIFSRRWEIAWNERASVWLTRILGWGSHLRDTALTSLVVWQCFTFIITYFVVLHCACSFNPSLDCVSLFALSSLDCVSLLTPSWLDHVLLFTPFFIGLCSTFHSFLEWTVFHFSIFLPWTTFHFSLLTSLDCFSLFTRSSLDYVPRFTLPSLDCVSLFTSHWTAFHFSLVRWLDYVLQSLFNLHTVSTSRLSRR
jgi:hypothetical protein